MRPTCGSCRWYDHVPHTDEPNPRTGQTRPSGFCHRLANVISEHTGVPRGRDLVDRSDWCDGWASAQRGDPAGQ